MDKVMETTGSSIFSDVLPVRPSLCLAGFVVFGLFFTDANAVDRIKANNNNNLNLTSSWVGGALPDSRNMAVWTNTVVGANTAALGANMTWLGIRIADPGGIVTISPGHTLTLRAGQTGTSIDMSAATQDLTIQSSLTLQTAVGQFWNIAAGRTLTLNTGTITRGTGATLNLQGAGTVNASALSNDATGILGPWATIGTGTSARFAMKDGSNNLVAFTGGTAAATAANVTDTTGTVNYDVAAVGTLGTGASFNTLRYTGASGTITGNFTANGILTAGSGALTMSGNVTIGANRELVLSNGDSNSARYLTLSGVISDGEAGSALTKAGNGTLILSGNNTYSGLTSATRGALVVAHNNALGSTAAGTRIGLSGRLQFNGGITSAESIWLDDTTNAFTGAIMILNSGTNTLTGAIRISNDTRWQSSGVLNVTGGITTTSANSTAVLQAADTLNITVKPLTLGHGGTLYMDNAGRTIMLGVAGSTYGSAASGGQSLYAGTLKAGAAKVFSRTARVSFSTSYSASAAALDLNGFDQTVGDIATGYYGVHDSFARRITSATAATLTTGGNNGSFTFDGSLEGAVSLTKVGTGTLFLSGPSTTTGGLTVNGGTVNLNFARAVASQSGAGSVSDSLSSASPLTLGGGNFTLTGRTNGAATSLTGASWSTTTNLGIITVASTTGLAPGQLVSHANLPAGAYVSSVLSGTQFVINLKPTVAGSGATITATANSFTTSQTFAGLILNAGRALVTATVPGGGSDGTVLNLNAITVNAGGTVNFTLPTGTQSATHGITTDNLNTHGILGAWARVGDHWATNATDAADGNITALTAGSYTDVNRLGGTITSNAAANVRIVDGGASGDVTPAAAGTTDIHTLLQTATVGTVTYNPGTTDVLRLGATGGIMVASTAKALTIGASDNDGMLTAGGAANTAGTLYLTNNHASDSLTIRSTIADNGTGVVGVTTAQGNIEFTGTNTYTGRTVIGAGQLRISGEENLGNNPVSFAADQLTLAGGRLYTTASFSIDDTNRGITLAAAGGDLFVGSGATLTLANAITGSGGLAVTGHGTLALTAANTFTGATTFGSNASTLALGHVDALKNSTLTTATVGNVTFTVAGTNTYNLGGLDGNDTVNLGANSIKVGFNDETTLFSGILSGSGDLIKTGDGTLALSGANTFYGVTRVEEGMIALNHADALKFSILDTGSVGTQSFNLTLGEGTNYNIGGLQGSADFDLGVANVIVGNNNTSTSFDGSLKGAFHNSVTKIGTGTLTMTGDSTYMGKTTVSGGALIVNGDNSAAIGEITVASGAHLGGDGVLGGDTTVVGKLHTGITNSAAVIGNLDFDWQDLTFNNGSEWLVDLVRGVTESSDAIGQIGSLTINSGSTLTFAPTGSYHGDESFTLASYTSLTGTFSNYSTSGVYTIGGNDYYLDYGTNALTLTAVPEPGVLGLLSVALGGFFWRTRRRRARRTS